MVTTPPIVTPPMVAAPMVTPMVATPPIVTPPMVAAAMVTPLVVTRGREGAHNSAWTDTAASHFGCTGAFENVLGAFY